MKADALVASLRSRGVQLYLRDGVVRCRAAAGALDQQTRAVLHERRPEILDLLERERGADVHGRLDRFLSDASLPAAVFHSRALNRGFLLVRDRDNLAVLTEGDQGLPIIFFSEAEKVLEMGLDGVRVLLDFRQTFGPSVELKRVRAGRPT